MATRTLRVYLDGTPIGTMTQSSHGALGFTYDGAYTGQDDPTPLSLSMPIPSSRHRDKAVRAYLEGLLPDREGVRQRWAREYSVSPNNPFGLLAHVGRDAAGAVQILPPDLDPADARACDGDIQWLSAADLSDLARDLTTHQSDWNPGRFEGRWSLAGAQPKIALFRDTKSGRFGIPRDSTPTTAILKPALVGYTQHHINEALCQRAAREAGLLAAESELTQIGEVQVLISTRYDRRHDGTLWHRVHQEDMCQALSVHPALKYQSDGGPGVGDVADLLNRLPVEDRAVNAERFFKALTYNVLIGGTDAHAKNYSLVLIGSRAQVAPMYDAASAAPYDQRDHLRSSMKIGEHWKMLDVNNSDWAKVGRRLGISAEQATAWVGELRNKLPDAFERAVASLALSARPEAGRMAERIIEHVAGTWKPTLPR
ncbi:MULTISPECIES: type II toxin-antitoxin system HipA family toxin [Mycolicibacterium]|jgi:serine/threonine-protein kinase HipA|uniref:Type II toxin-antitoxin system HipA family toxin n=1 Tax=Mycolicibacterium austroafricanum TaxID=39687 RepID=A0ABT8H7F6_MYCAO|nr:MULTISPECIES: type II toxin-antitoxin system HipA family toxin [Mycolicibacterium]MDN4516694.1 type II toxin-antitoxin system HipA family toxin [Mycolicibacterium austroafricanum]MDW5614078.1 type II toxin-antitoxin system HipA family toxin [Mycolicibacterium sp. D5.8-2]PQP50300.1 type II toxin-antitoxin system HipA family toxin [Mycolicibacterium austroafricanum]QRZ07798.1 type II toxin-antitoxin system HipA family toxin [Mycolicibacterium austroafricanum]QZT57924.1 type II toxin-antitoxin